MDGANLRDADLRFSSLKGASLRGSDLRGAQLDGTDLRQADLSGTLINPGELERSHWLGAIGINQAYAACVTAQRRRLWKPNAGRWRQAEHLFGEAIQAEPNKP